MSGFHSTNEQIRSGVHSLFNLFCSSARTMLANRISFALALHGPSTAIDSACSSSMYALDAAYKSIMCGESDAAIVGGTNLLLQPYLTLQFARLGVLSKNGLCKCRCIHSFEISSKIHHQVSHSIRMLLGTFELKQTAFSFFSDAVMRNESTLL
jgi:hypothetical protein